MLDAGFWILDTGYLMLDTRQIATFTKTNQADMSYKNLEIWKLSREVVIEVHQMSLSLPKFEQFEEAQQIRRSSKTIKSCIVEGYGRRRYKADFIKFLIYSLSSNDETLDHLETLFETGSIKDENLYQVLHQKIEVLGKKINNFLQSVERRHNEF